MTDIRQHAVYFKQCILLVKRIALVFLIYFVSRLIFFVANHKFFPEAGAGSFLADAFYGLRFDAFSIVLSNSILILISLIPHNLNGRSWFEKATFWIFIIPNTLFLAFNFIDVAYFEFIHKRSTAEVFDQIGGQTDLGELIPSFAKDFWWVIVLFVICIVLMVRIYKRISVPFIQYGKGSASQWVRIVLLFVLLAGLSVLGVRGGLQRVPIDVVNAGAVVRTDEVPVVLNTPFTIIKSFNQKSLPVYNFYDQEDLTALFDPIHHFKDSTFTKQNVVVIILESFCKEYTALSGKNRRLTPFLDSLMRHSLVCTNGYSNGTKSIEGIPAILSGLPSLSENPFINSQYANNRQTSIASLLGEEGYSTAFFHGGINGTMNFDDWAYSAGYQHYYGRNEYGNEKDFDGFWGIWDEPFLQYTAKKIGEMKAPFHAAVFTLSSHHPYFVPKKYEKSLPDRPYENSKSIAYADLSLRKFFETASKTSWYSNTLFVISADHGSLSEDPFYVTVLGNESIPILFFRPDNSLAGTYGKAFSQADILASSMKLIGYNKPFFSFGQPLYTNRKHCTYLYLNGMYHLFGDTIMNQFIGPNISSSYWFRQDSSLQYNRVGLDKEKDEAIQRYHRAFLQTYDSVLNKNAGAMKLAGSGQ